MGTADKVAARLMESIDWVLEASYVMDANGSAPPDVVFCFEVVVRSTGTPRHVIPGMRRNIHRQVMKEYKTAYHKQRMWLGRIKDAGNMNVLTLNRHTLKSPTYFEAVSLVALLETVLGEALTLERSKSAILLSRL